MSFEINKVAYNGAGGTGSTKATEFDNWTNSEENYNKALYGAPVEQFQMFNFNPSSYSKDLKNFAQSYVDKFDANTDGAWNYDEFVSMAMGGQVSAEQLQADSDAFASLVDFYQNGVVAQYDIDGDGVWNKAEFFSSQGIDINNLSGEERKSWEEAYKTFNMYGGDTIDATEVLMAANLQSMPGLLNAKNSYDINNLMQTQHTSLDIDGDGSVSGSEFAAQLYMSDLDLVNYAATNGDVASSIDGKIDYSQYQSLSSLTPDSDVYDTMQYLKESFYNNFYGN